MFVHLLQNKNLIDYIDIVEEQLVPASDCNQQDDDPRYYISTKTKRGPLSDNWIQEYWNDGKPIKPIMCAYKLCRVEFKYWGMQNKIERFIHESGNFFLKTIFICLILI